MCYVFLKPSCFKAPQQTTGLHQITEPNPSGLSHSKSSQVAEPTTCHQVETRCQESDTHLMAEITLAQRKHTGAQSEYQCKSNNCKRVVEVPGKSQDGKFLKDDMVVSTIYGFHSYNFIFGWPLIFS